MHQDPHKVKDDSMSSVSKMLFSVISQGEAMLWFHSLVLNDAKMPPTTFPCILDFHGKSWRKNAAVLSSEPLKRSHEYASMIMCMNALTDLFSFHLLVLNQPLRQFCPSSSLHGVPWDGSTHLLSGRPQLFEFLIVYSLAFPYPIKAVVI